MFTLLSPPGSVNGPRRSYNAPRRAESAARTREAVIRAAAARFEERGWAGTTIPAVAAEAGVSPKTVEALFATKARLLGAVVDYAIRGDADDTPMIEREAGRAVEQAPDAESMLARHAAYAADIGARSARIAAVVEAAAGADPRVAELAARMARNRRFGARWAAGILLAKPGAPAPLEADEAERAFLVAIDPGTYRVLAHELGMGPDGVRDWIAGYYRRMLLA